MCKYKSDLLNFIEKKLLVKRKLERKKFTNEKPKCRLKNQ